MYKNTNCVLEIHRFGII